LSETIDLSPCGKGIDPFHVLGGCDASRRGAAPLGCPGCADRRLGLEPPGPRGRAAAARGFKAVVPAEASRPGGRSSRVEAGRCPEPCRHLARARLSERGVARAGATRLPVNSCTRASGPPHCHRGPARPVLAGLCNPGPMPCAGPLRAPPRRSRVRVGRQARAAADAAPSPPARSRSAEGPASGAVTVRARAEAASARSDSATPARGAEVAASTAAAADSRLD
jgi:hypothetical protein